MEETPESRGKPSLKISRACFSLSVSLRALLGLALLCLLPSLSPAVISRPSPLGETVYCHATALGSLCSLLVSRTIQCYFLLREDICFPIGISQSSSAPTLGLHGLCL